MINPGDAGLPVAEAHDHAFRTQADEMRSRLLIGTSSSLIL